MIKNNIILIIIISFSLYACSSVKDAVQPKKRSEQSDEFLVEKKNPLAMPPDFDKLPTPGNQEVSPETFSDSEELKDLLKIEDSNETNSNNSDQLDIESSIIEKIQ